MSQNTIHKTGQNSKATIESTREELSKLSTDQLRQICRQEAVSTETKTEDEQLLSAKKLSEAEQFIEKIILKRFGFKNKFIPGLTFCTVCGAEVKSLGEESENNGDGTETIYFVVKCVGKRRHEYTLFKEVKKI